MSDQEGGSRQPLVHADMVYVPYPNGGAVFATGSISYAGCLSHNRYDNNISRITANVLKRFLEHSSEAPATPQAYRGRTTSTRRHTDE